MRENPVRRALRGIGAAIRGRPGLFVAVALGVFALDLFLPVAVLSLARKPWDYFAFNAWLPNLPAYLASDVPLPRKLEFLWGLALFWFIADSPYGGPEWGFAVGVGDLARFAVTSLVFGAFFTLWAYRRERAAAGACAVAGAGTGRGRQVGLLGAVGSVLGLSTGPCSVMGCGAPVIPVVGLAFAGLSSGTLALMAQVSRAASSVIMAGMAAAVAYLGWQAGGGAGTARETGEAGPAKVTADA